MPLMLMQRADSFSSSAGPWDRREVVSGQPLL